MWRQHYAGHVHDIFPRIVSVSLSPVVTSTSSPDARSTARKPNTSKKLLIVHGSVKIDRCMMIQPPCLTTSHLPLPPPPRTIQHSCSPPRNLSSVLCDSPLMAQTVDTRATLDLIKYTKCILLAISCSCETLHALSPCRHSYQNTMEHSALCLAHIGKYTLLSQLPLPHIPIGTHFSLWPYSARTCLHIQLLEDLRRDVASAEQYIHQQEPFPLPPSPSLSSPSPPQYCTSHRPNSQLYQHKWSSYEHTAAKAMCGAIKTDIDILIRSFLPSDQDE